MTIYAWCQVHGKMKTLFLVLAAGGTALSCVLVSVSTGYAWGTRADGIVAYGMWSSACLLLSMLVWIPSSRGPLAHDVRATSSILALCLSSSYAGTLHDDVGTAMDASLAFSGALLYLVTAVVSHALGPRVKREASGRLRRGSLSYMGGVAT